MAFLCTSLWISIEQEVPPVGGCGQGSRTSWKLSQRPGVLLCGWCALLREGIASTKDQSTHLFRVHWNRQCSSHSGDAKGFLFLLPEEPAPGPLSFYATPGGMEGHASHMPRGLLTLVFCKVIINTKALLQSAKGSGVSLGLFAGIRNGSNFIIF